ncbi:MAG TPA: hypothetical protein VFJ85_08780 [Acidimicrobiales bacterium]|nr:hypothetical protein [Acidimicrobiales bacterium]
MSNRPPDTNVAEYREASINAAQVRARRAEERAGHAVERAEEARAKAGSSRTPGARLRHLQEAARMEHAVEFHRDAAQLQWHHVADESARQRTAERRTSGGPGVEEHTS